MARPFILVAEGNRIEILRASPSVIGLDHRTITGETAPLGVRFAATFPTRSYATDDEQTIEQIISGAPAW
jgi:hypothetical protein